MAVRRDRPYTQFNFLVDLGDGDAEAVQAGFQEVSGIGMEVVVTEYRNGNASVSSSQVGLFVLDGHHVLLRGPSQARVDLRR